MNSLTKLSELSGVGEKRTKLYGKLGLNTVGDLLYYYPRAYIDFTDTTFVASSPDNMPVSVKAIVLKKHPVAKIRKGMSIYKITAADDTSSFTVVFFNNPYAFEGINVGEEYIFHGKFLSGNRRREMSSPIFVPVTDEVTMKPIYPLTAGLTSNMISTNVKESLKIFSTAVRDYLNSQIREKYHLCHISYALENIHFPTDQKALDLARYRLAFEELLILQLALRKVKAQKTVLSSAKMEKVSLSPFYDSLPFSLTNAQKRSIEEAVSDMASNKVMNRLVQGDVGSGKTMVSAACVYFAFKNGHQSALMAPTEILARQHYATFNKCLSAFGVRVCLLVSSMKQSEKKAVLKALKDGECDILVGTNAIISETVEFKSLGLVITDEQHRFGVAQRAALSGKGNNPHTLVMSATPIPRTLSLIIYGDLDLSIIDELPPGRQTIQTVVITPEIRKRAFSFIEKEIEAGRQAYIICPLIEDDEESGSDAASVKEYEKKLSAIFPNLKIGTLHGKMKANEKEEAMRAFSQNETNILVSTTVVEVGVDVPNSTIILVENAEKFGLSQLHQLRGRVGRGQFQSTCILVCENSSGDALKRLEVLKNTTDGFEIAKQDMAIRGAGDLIGVRQHGLPKLKIAELKSDERVIYSARDAAVELLESDPTLSLSENKFLNKKVLEMLENVINN